MKQQGMAIDRRSILAQLGLTGFGLSAASLVGSRVAIGKESDFYTPGRMSPVLSPGAGLRPRATFHQPAKLDLNDPYHLQLARLKAMNSLNGKTTYNYVMAYHTMCEPNKPPYPIYAELELATLWFERTEDMADTEAIVQIMFTRAPVDHRTFEPIDSFYNPYADREIPLKYTLMAGSGAKIDLAGNAEPNFVTQSDEPHFRLGDDISFIMFDPDKRPEIDQPKIDKVFWRVNYEELMDQDRPVIDSDTSYTALMKASHYPMWAGPDADNRAQVLTTKVGRKVDSVERLPKEVKQAIVDVFPDRV